MDDAELAERVRMMLIEWPDIEVVDVEHERMPQVRITDGAVEVTPNVPVLVLTDGSAYRHAAVIRQAWNDAGVHPRDIASLADFRVLRPVRRQARDTSVPRRTRRSLRRPLRDPAGRADGRHVDFGHHGRSDARAREVGRREQPALDHHAATSGAWACARAITSRSCCSRTAARRTGSFQRPRHRARPVRLRPGRDGAVLRPLAPIPARPASTTSAPCSSTPSAKSAIGGTSTRPTCSPRTKVSCSRASR